MAEHKELGFDDSPPRNAVIFAVGAASVLSLALLVPLFEGYFDHMYRSEQAEKLAQARERMSPLEENLAAQERQLSSARISVEDAMGQLARVGRRVGPEPQPSTDLQAVLGWNQRPHQAAADAAQRAMEGAAGEEGTEGEGAPEEGAEGEATEGAAPAEGASPGPTEGAAAEGQGE